MNVTTAEIDTIYKIIVTAQAYKPEIGRTLTLSKT
jgi:hypothetical protein